MGLPNVGPVELIIVLAIALVVMGPRRLPEMGSALGKTIREFRQASSAIADPATARPAAEHPVDEVGEAKAPNSASAIDVGPDPEQTIPPRSERR